MDWATIIASLITFAGTVLSALLAKFILNKRERAKCTVVTDSDNAENVYLSLEYLMEASGCDRAYVMQFHNGGHYVSGKSQQRFSCTHEVCSKGISIECEKSQNHLISNFNHYIKELIRNKEYTYVDIEKISDQSFRNLLEYKGVKAIYNLPLKTLEGKMIGILGLDYVKDPPNESICEKFEDIDNLKDLNTFMRRQSRIMTGYLV